MSSYPIWWDSTVTIYNKFEDNLTHIIKWYRTVINNAFWNHVKDKMTVGNETIEVEKTVCRIRQTKNFVEKYKWINIPNDIMPEYFTLGTGDIIIRGEVTDEIDEYTDGIRSTDIIEKYKNLQGCMEVETVSINTGRGRCNPHYLAEGL